MFDVPEEVTLFEAVGLSDGQDDAAFYTDGGGATLIAQASGQGGDYSVYAVGEMRIHYNGSVLRYTSDLFDAGIKTDADLELIGPDEWENNPWFEVFEDDNGDSGWNEIFHSAREAVEYAIKMASEPVNDLAEIGECDTCGCGYELASRDGRCGDCGDCGKCCKEAK